VQDDRLGPEDSPLPTLSTERRAIVACIRAALGLGESRHSAALADWDEALAWARRQHVMPLIQAGRAALDLPFESPIRKELRGSYVGSAVWVQTVLEPVLRRALGALTAAGCEPIVLKGAALAYQVYPAPAYRSMGDVDLLVAGEQIGQASKALLAAGFGVDPDEYQPTHHLRPFRAPGYPLPVELHHRLLVEPHRYSIDLDEIRGRAQVRTLAGVQARVLDPADALLHTCVHLTASHRYLGAPLRDLTDILALTTRRNIRLDWSFFLDLVARSRTAGAVYWPLFLSRRWLGAPVPSWVLTRLAPPSPIRNLLARIAEPGFILDRQSPAGAGSAALYEVLLSVSLHTACSVRQQAAGLIEALLLSDGAVDKRCALPPARPTRLGGRLRYLARVTRPARFAKAAGAISRLLWAPA
jgi:hypothetical protein